MNRIQSGALLATALSALSIQSAFALEGGHKLSVSTRIMYWDDVAMGYPVSPTNRTVPAEYTQSAIGIRADYESPYWNGWFGVDASLFAVGKIDDTGTPSVSIFEVTNSGKVEDSWTQLGQAVVKLKLGESAQVRIGRQAQSSLMLRSSSTRAMPDTYSGITGNWKPLAGLNLYGMVYDSWRARSTGRFAKFKTESRAAGVPYDIDYIGILGTTYVSGPVSITAEYLNSKDYLKKYGLVGAYTIPIDKDSLKLSAGIFNSRDGGSLFVCGAESELNCAGTGRMDYSATGIYVDADWKFGNTTLGAGISKFNGQWIEDHYAADALRTGTLNQDHGSNPFPTGTILGPDFANKDEVAHVLRASYNWKEYVPGLNTTIKHVRGTGAKASNQSSAAIGSENYTEINIQYAVPMVKGLNLSYAYGDYHSKTENFTSATRLKGMGRQDWTVNRYYIDYTYKF